MSSVIGVSSRALRFASAVAMMPGLVSMYAFAALVISEALTVLILILFTFMASLIRFRASRIASVIVAPEAFLTFAAPVILILPSYIACTFSMARSLIACLRSASTG